MMIFTTQKVHKRKLPRKLREQFSVLLNTVTYYIGIADCKVQLWNGG
jgi:hypothetical protein